MSQYYTFYSEVSDYTYYFFKTSNGIIYEVSFRPTPYLFESGFPFAECVYESVIKVVEKGSNNLIPFDKKVKRTIAEIFYHFFTDKQRIIIYICDTADARHQARARKFGAWFDEFKHGQFVKVNTTIVDHANLVYLNALILHIENPYFIEIIDAFRKVTGGYTQDK
jgi:hypothetical protein